MVSMPPPGFPVDPPSGSPTPAPTPSQAPGDNPFGALQAVTGGALLGGMITQAGGNLGLNPPNIQAQNQIQDAVRLIDEPFNNTTSGLPEPGNQPPPGPTEPWYVSWINGIMNTLFPPKPVPGIDLLQKALKEQIADPPEP